MNKFLMWFHRNSYQIGWFIIGWMSLQGLNDLLKGDYFNAVLSWVLVGLNYAMVRR